MRIPVHIIITKYILTRPSLALQNYKDTKTMHTAVRSMFITQVIYNGR